MRTKLLATGALLAFSLIGAAGYGIGTNLANNNQATPHACLEALDIAETVIGLAGEGMQYAADGFGAAAEFDLAGMERASEGMTRVGDDVAAQTDGYLAASSECRG